MIRQLIVVLLTCFMFAPSVLAGTFRDDFEDGNLDGWMETAAKAPIEGVWKVESGVLVGRRASGWGAHLSLGDDESTWRDYTIECDMRIIERIVNEWGSRFHYAGPVGRFQAENRLTRDILGIVLNLTASPTVWDFVIVQEDQWLRDSQTPVEAELNTWYRLKFTAKGDDFELYIDDSLASSFNSGAISRGRIGLCIGGCATQFDNVTINGPDVPDSGPSGLFVGPQTKLATTWAEVKAN